MTPGNIITKVATIARGSLSTKLLTTVIVLIALLLVIPYVVTRVGREIHDVRPNHEGLPINELISRVKQELSQAVDERVRNQERALFKLESFELEISFIVKTGQKTGGSLTHTFVTVDNETHVNAESVQKIVLKMTAIPPVERRQPAALSRIDGPDESMRLHSPPPPEERKKP